MLKRVGILIAIAVFVCTVGSARAQEDSAGVASQPEMGQPISVAGCWQGTVFNTAFCSTDCLFTLFFKQKGASINKKGSTFAIDYTGTTPVMGAIHGSSRSSMSFPVKFHGVAFKGCSIHFAANLPSPGMMTGNFQYSGPCTENQFTSGDFDAKFLGATCP
jgi:hypothetical protein